MRPNRIERATQTLCLQRLVTSREGLREYVNITTVFRERCDYGKLRISKSIEYRATIPECEPSRMTSTKRQRGTGGA